MDRRAFIDAIAGGVLAAPLSAWAQPTAKVWRIGLIGVTPPANPEHVAADAAFRQVLLERGYVEGKNLVYEKRYAQGNVALYPVLAAELVRLNVDLITVNAGSTAVRAAKEATKTIPIVMVMAADPVEFGLVDSLARPGGNVTGNAVLPIETLGKRLGLLKAAVPSIERVVYLRGAGTRGTDSAAAALAHELTVAAKALGITILWVEMSASQPFDGVAAAINRERPDALLLGASATLGARINEIAEFAIQRRLPSMAAVRGLVESGVLMSYGEVIVDIARSAAAYVDKILRGAKPADLPVERPTRFELAINLKTARAIGLTIPQSVMLRADEVIQ